MEILAHFLKNVAHTIYLMFMLLVLALDTDKSSFWALLLNAEEIEWLRMDRALEWRYFLSDHQQLIIIILSLSF